MLKRLCFVLLLCCCSILAQAADVFARWTPHLSYYDGKECVRDGRYLYTLMGDNLLVCDVASRTTTAIDRVSHGLARKRIAHIGLSRKHHTLVLLYADGHIDLLRTERGEVIHLPQLANYQQQALTVDRLRVQDDDAFVTTNAGFLWIDIAQAFIRGHYAVGQCQDVARWGDQIFAAFGGKLQRIALRNNLNDRSLWTLAFDHNIAAITTTPTACFVAVPPSENNNAGLWRAAATTADAARSLAARTTTEDFMRIDTQFTGQQLQVDAEGSILAFQPGRVTQIVPTNASATPSNFTLTRTDLPSTAQCVETDGQGGWWLGFSDLGIVRRPANATDWNATTATTFFGRTGPRYDLAYFMRYRQGDLLIACGRLDPTDQISYPQMAEVFDGKTCKFLQTPQPDEGYQGIRFQNATSIDRSPINPTEYAVTTGRTGIYLYNDARIKQQYSLHNSPLVSAEKRVSAAMPNYVRTDGALYDAQGNLFVLNSSADTALHVLSPRGTWTDIPLQGLDNAPTLEKTMFDSKGRLWAVSRRTTNDYPSGFVCLDYNGTIGNIRDDVATFRSSMTNQDGESITYLFATSLAEDRDGAIWLGTNEGIFRVDNPDEWSNRNFRITQVKVPRNDGSNLADYLLAGVNISAIAVDGANRKWVGTADNGLYLLSPDGLQVLQHFTIDNSPLYSNEIWSIACHPTSGEVMIGTSAGLLSYQAGASTPAETLSTSNIRVYPNPVTPDYVGNIIVDGLVADAEVRVVNASGQLVARGMSLGGTFTWDGRSARGERVASGVYSFYISAANGTQTAVGKVAIVR